MGLMDKLKKTAGAADDYGDYDNDNGYYDEITGGDLYTDDVVDDTPVDTGYTAPSTPSYSSPRQSSLSVSGNALEMKVVRPEHFDSVTQIADHLLEHRTVVLNLENTSKETSRRLIDFLSGVAYSINGSLKKIATSAYIITPDNVDVGDAKLKSDKAPKEEAPAAAPAGMSDEFADL
ncbi:MAG: cell division protein SepF [Clostridia bacterium]|nr:cell division protein SepF [Clostridia bacterium]